MTRFGVRPEVQQELEAALGRPLPDPSALEFLPFLKELSRSHPDLARKLRQGLVPAEAERPQVPKALQSQVRQGQARERRRNLVRLLFQRQGWQGLWVPDKRKLLLWGVLGASLGVGALLFTLGRPTLKAQTPDAVGRMGQTLNAPDAPAKTPSPPAGTTAGAPLASPMPAPPSQAVAPSSPASALPTLPPPPPALPTAPSPGFSTAPSSFPLTPPGSPSSPSSPDRPGLMIRAQGQPAKPAAPLIYAAQAELGSPSTSAPDQTSPDADSGPGKTSGAGVGAQTPAPAALARRPVVVYTRAATEVSALTNPSQAEIAARRSFVVFSDDAKGKEGRSSVVFARQSQGVEPGKTTPAAPDPTQPQGQPGPSEALSAQPAPLTQYQRGVSQTQPSLSPAPSPNKPAPTDGQLTTLYQRANPSSSPPPAAPNVTATPTSPPSPQSSPTAPPSPQPSAVPDAYSPGQQIPAKLATEIVAPEGAQVPVVADSEGASWIGTAGLDASRRVQVVFDRVVQGGQVTELQAVALSPQGVPGVEPILEEQAPSLASDTLRAAMNGVSAYVQGLAGASSSTVLPSGGAVQSKEAPPLGLTLLGEVGKLFALPQGQSSVVRLARVEKGTPVLILVGAGVKPSVRP